MIQANKDVKYCTLTKELPAARITGSPSQSPPCKFHRRKVKASNQTQGQKEVTFIKKQSSSNLKDHSRKDSRAQTWDCPKLFRKNLAISALAARPWSTHVRY
jgi:hypothetical protein